MYNRTAKNSKILSNLLSIWIYTEAIFYFVPLIIPDVPLLKYIWLATIAGIILYIEKKIPVRLVVFLFVYSIVAIINMMVVSYKYYVAIDAFSGMAIFLPALLCISSCSFDLSDFFRVWRRYAFFSTLVSPIAIFLVQIRVINYGVFTYLNLPNCIFFSYGIMSMIKGDRGKAKLMFLDLVNFIIILAFGGRMAAVAAATAIAIGYMLSPSVNTIKKVLIIIVLGIASVVVISNLKRVLALIQALFDILNLSSRSLSLIMEQLSAGNTGIYLTGRDIIYGEVVDYIISRAGLPGGFGVSLSISNGHFYHPHNLFLQLSVMFGVLGCVLFLFAVLRGLVLIRRHGQHFEYHFVLLLLIVYFIISLTGGSILSNWVAIFGIGMVFFYRGENIKIQGD